MDLIKFIGLLFMGFGIFGLIIYGLYHLLKEITSIDILVLTLALSTTAGIILLLIATFIDYKHEKVQIKKEDLEP